MQWLLVIQEVLQTCYLGTFYANVMAGLEATMWSCIDGSEKLR